MCNFSVPFTGNVDNLITIAKKAIADASGTFNEDTVPAGSNARSGNFFVSTSLGHVTGSYKGDTTSGNLTVSASVGHIAASYKTDGSSLSIEISHKPFLVSCDTIQQQLEECIKQKQPGLKPEHPEENIKNNR